MMTEEQAGLEENYAQANTKKIDFETELALQFIEMNDINTSPYQSVKQMKQFLVNKGLVKDENEVEVIRGPFTEVELKFLEIDDPDEREEIKFEKKMEVDEEFNIKCSICPKANYEEGYQIFLAVCKELPVAQ